MPSSAEYVDPKDSRVRCIHISEVQRGYQQEWQCISCHGSMHIKCWNSADIRMHFAHNSGRECPNAGESDEHVLLKRWICHHWRSILTASCDYCNKAFLPQRLHECTADTEVPWNDEHGNRYVADVGLKNAQTGELTGCIEVVHTHINADKKEKAK